jgi:transposase
MAKGKCKNMLEVRDVIHRLRNGQSNRLIEREIGVDRSIVQKIKELSIAHHWLDSESVIPTDEEICKVWNSKSKSQKSHPLDLHRDSLEQWRKEGYSAPVIYRLLKDKCPCNPQMIRRYLNRNFPKTVQPVMVRPTTPGQDMDIDFGYLGILLDNEGTKRKAWVFSFRLRHSRRTYREVVLDQKANTFLLCHIHAFEWFGGVPKNVILDNCKAAVIQCTIDNDMIRRSYQELAEHYGFIISPCLPRTPEHKGGVEGDIKFVKGNFLPFFNERQRERKIALPKIQDLTEALEHWGREVADTHIIYGVGRSPLEIFKEEEEKVLQPLPKNRWELTVWSQCVVRKDWRIMCDSAYYAVPYQLIGKTVQVCATTSLVRIFYNHKEVAYHERAKKKWEYKRKAEYAPPLEEEVLQCSREGLLSLAEKVGPSTFQLVEGILSHPSIDKLRPVRHLLQLARKYSQERLEKACHRALIYKMFSYASVKNILENNLDCQPICTEPTSKIIQLPKFRFARDLAPYRSNNEKETFEEKMQRLHSTSTCRNAQLGIFEGLLADQIMQEEIELLKSQQKE